MVVGPSRLAFQGNSRSSNVTKINRLPMTFYWWYMVNRLISYCFGKVQSKRANVSHCSI